MLLMKLRMRVSSQMSPIKSQREMGTTSLKRDEPEEKLCYHPEPCLQYSSAGWRSIRTKLDCSDVFEKVR